jgi:hypothetical protein
LSQLFRTTIGQPLGERRAAPPNLPWAPTPRSDEAARDPRTLGLCTATSTGSGYKCTPVPGSRMPKGLWIHISSEAPLAIQACAPLACGAAARARARPPGADATRWAATSHTAAGTRARRGPVTSRENGAAPSAGATAAARSATAAASRGGRSSTATSSTAATPPRTRQNRPEPDVRT